MSDRTPDDLLGSLLTGKKTAPEDTEKPQKEPIQAEDRSSRKKASESFLESPGGKAKATYYLDESVLSKLDEAWLALRKMAINRTSISKSWIVEQAILMAVQELESKGSKSKIAKRIPKE